MRVSERTRLGLRALLRLAARDGSGSLSAAQIARAENLSAQGLAQVLNFLKRRGLVKSVRGPTGGYVLARRPADIRLSELLERLDGKPEAWTSDGDARAAGDEAGLSAALFWGRLAEAIDKGLSAATVQDLVDEARQSRRRGRAPYTFNI